MSSLLCTCLFFFMSFHTIYATHDSYSSDAIKGAYFPSDRRSTLPPSSIETKLFTHIYYAFLLPNKATFIFEIDNPTAIFLLNFTSTLHAKNPGLKTLFSTGGGGDNPFDFSPMASNPALRKNFILSSIEVARKLGFDGMDLDWEFPQNPREMEDYGTLLHEWRAEVIREANKTCGPQLLLSAAVYFSPTFFSYGNYRTYPTASIEKNLDWINVMFYDYHGSWDTSITGSQSALFDPNSKISTSYGLASWISSGVSRTKLVMGFPLYGRTWTLKDAGVRGVGAQAVGVGPEGDGGKGVLLYYEVVRFNKKHNASVKFDLSTVSAYSVAGNSWVGYDDYRSTALKLGYAQIFGIRGYFFWALGFDHHWEISKKASQFWVL